MFNCPYFQVKDPCTHCIRGQLNPKALLDGEKEKFQHYWE
jgi:hypothetical protein